MLMSPKPDIVLPVAASLVCVALALVDSGTA